MPYISEVALEIIAIQSAALARKYRGFAEREDIQQEMALWVVEHERDVDRWLDVDPDDKEERKRGEAALALTVRRIGEQYCRSEKAHRAGYKTEDEFFYTAGMIEELLPVVFGVKELPAPPPGAKRTSPANEGGNQLAMVEDVRQALGKVPVELFGVIVARFSQGMELKQIAKEQKCSLSKASRDVQRGVLAVLNGLGGENPWPDKERTYRRQVATNAQAIASLGDLE